MTNIIARFISWVGLAGLSVLPFQTQAQGYPIAGVDPSQRPVGAPVIETVVKPAGWYTTALTGISQPYPQSLRFLEDQGNWYTPFNEPGMAPRYDIRGWYTK